MHQSKFSRDRAMNVLNTVTPIVALRLHEARSKTCADKFIKTESELPGFKLATILLIKFAYQNEYLGTSKYTLNKTKSHLMSKAAHAPIQAVAVQHMP